MVYRLQITSWVLQVLSSVSVLKFLKFVKLVLTVKLLPLILSLILNNMCSTPITIPNPYYHLGNKGVNYLYNTADSHIAVPCGSCPQCVAMRQAFYVQRIQMESLRSHLFMFTLTYNNESMLTTDIGEYNIPFACFKDIQTMFKRFRNDGIKFRVSYVTEYGKEHHRPHFHGIFAVDKSEGDYRFLERKFYKLFFTEWKRNYGSSRSPLWYPLFTPVYEHCKCKTFDFHYIEPVMDHDNDCAFYVSKYITKYDSWIRKLLMKIKLDPNLSGEEIVFLLYLLKPRCITSKDFGSYDYPAVRRYINKCASRESLFKWPQYYDIYSGKQMPMSPFYGKRCISFQHLYNRFLRSDFTDFDSTIFASDDTCLDISQLSDSAVRQFLDFEKKLKKLENRLEL